MPVPPGGASQVRGLGSRNSGGNSPSRESPPRGTRTSGASYRPGRSEAPLDRLPSSNAAAEWTLDPVIVLSPTGEITGWNAQAERLFGRSSAEVAGARLAETVIAPRQRALFEPSWRHLLESAGPASLHHSLETIATDREGREFPVELTVAGLGSGAGFQAHARDITERRHGEAVARAIVEG